MHAIQRYLLELVPLHREHAVNRLEFDDISKWMHIILLNSFVLKSDSTICIWINSIAMHIDTRLHTNTIKRGIWNILKKSLKILEEKSKICPINIRSRDREHEIHTQPFEERMSFNKISDEIQSRQAISIRCSFLINQLQIIFSFHVYNWN